MSDFGKSVIIFGAGLAIGYLGTRILENPEGSRVGAVSAVSRGMAIKEKVMTGVEKTRENVEDMVAEAGHARQTTNEGKDAPEGADSP